MKLLLFLFAIQASAAVTNFQLVGATSTQLVVSYTAPTMSACTLEASTGSGYTPLARDVDTAYYTSASSDDRAGNLTLGRYRVFVIGKQGADAIETALDGYAHSRALQAATTYYLRVTCGGDTDTLTARTTNIPLGDSRGQALAADSTLWKYKQVTTNKIANPEFADPYTGALIKNPPALLGFGYAQSTATSDEGYSPSGCNVTLTGVKGSCTFTEATGTNWGYTSTSLNAAISADDNNYATYSGTTQDKLWLQLGTTGKYPVNATTGQTLSFQNLHFSAKTSDASGEGGWMRVCLTHDGVNCASPSKRVTLTATEAVYSVCHDSPCTTKDNPGDVMYSDAGGTIPGAARVYNESGSLTTLKFAGSNATTACNELIVGETIYVYDSRTDENYPYSLTVDAKSCGSSPPQITIPSGYNLTHNGTTGVTFWRYDGLAGSRYGALVWKESTTSGSTISIDLPLWRAATSVPWVLSFGFGGFGKRCQNVPTADGYYLCMTGQEANVIIGVKPAAGGGLDIVNYGGAYYRGTQLNAGLVSDYNFAIQSAAGNEALWDDELPGVLYATFGSAAGCGSVIVKITLSLATPSAADPDGTFPSGTRFRQAGISSATILTPCGSGASDFSLNTQRGRISSEWLDKGTLFPNCKIEAVQGKTLIEHCRAGSQDSHGFVFAYDLGNREPAGAGFVGTQGGNTQQAYGGFLVSANPASRWCGIHTYQNPLSAAGSPFALVETANTAPMYLTVSTALTACDSRSNPGTCGACPNVTVDGFNYNGKNWCATIDVSSSCSGVSAPAGCTDGDPVSSGAGESPNLKWYQGLAVGDVIRYDSERMKLLVKNSQTQWVVLRGWGYQSNSASADIMVPITTGGGGSWATSCGAHSKNPLVTTPEVTWGLAWYFNSDTDGTNSAYTFLNRFQNHGFHSANYGVFPEYTSAKFDFSDPSENAAAITSGSTIGLPSSFAGKSTDCTGNTCEKHPGANQVLGDTRWFADVHPRLFHPSGANGVALASGKTYIYQYNGSAVISPKHFDLEAYMGRYPMRRTDTLTDSASDTGKWCVPVVANDCFSGSTAGKMYFVNEVFDSTFIALRTCRESQFGTTNGDACMGPSNGIGASVSQWRVPATNGIAYSNGDQARAVSKEWRTYRETAYENVKADPTGTALLARAMWYIAPPPFPGEDTRNRGTFASIPVTISSVPAGTSTALVQFGYNASFQCSRNRDNTCYAEAATVTDATPYKFDHETLTGLSCASGCTIAIPALANRVLYWRMVFRDSGGNVLSRGATNVQTVN